ncbi:hypothetical protein JOE11_001024 [Robbsia andropogonis]
MRVCYAISTTRKTWADGRPSMGTGHDERAPGPMLSRDATPQA